MASLSPFHVRRVTPVEAAEAVGRQRGGGDTGLGEENESRTECGGPQHQGRRQRMHRLQICEFKDDETSKTSLLAVK